MHATVLAAIARAIRHPHIIMSNLTLRFDLTSRVFRTYQRSRIVDPFVASVDNHADFFTKPLKPARFFVLRDRIMNVR